MILFWIISLSHTWIGEDPSGDVCPCAHDVLYIQTGLYTSFSSPLGSYNSIHLRPMLEATTEHGHELRQVGGMVILLQKLKEKAASYSEKLHHVIVRLKTWSWRLYG